MDDQDDSKGLKFTVILASCIVVLAAAGIASLVSFVVYTW